MASRALRVLAQQPDRPFLPSGKVSGLQALNRWARRRQRAVKTELFPLHQYSRKLTRKAAFGHKQSLLRSKAQRLCYFMNPSQSAYEIAGGLGLPAEYVEFLATCNGGVCRQDRSIRLSDGTEVLCDCLFGFNLQPGIDFQFWQSELAHDLPKGSVAIGSDPGGAFFLLLKERGVWKVMYYDHAHQLPSSNDDGNTYYCDISLHDLLAFVTEDYRAKE